MTADHETLRQLAEAVHERVNLAKQWSSDASVSTQLRYEPRALASLATKREFRFAVGTKAGELLILAGRTDQPLATKAIRLQVESGRHAVRMAVWLDSNTLLVGKHRGLALCRVTNSKHTLRAKLQEFQWGGQRSFVFGCRIEGQQRTRTYICVRSRDGATHIILPGNDFTYKQPNIYPAPAFIVGGYVDDANALILINATGSQFAFDPTLSNRSVGSIQLPDAQPLTEAITVPEWQLAKRTKHTEATSEPGVILALRTESFRTVVNLRGTTEQRGISTKTATTEQSPQIHHNTHSNEGEAEALQPVASPDWNYTPDILGQTAFALRKRRNSTPEQHSRVFWSIAAAADSAPSWAQWDDRDPENTQPYAVRTVSGAESAALSKHAQPLMLDIAVNSIGAVVIACTLDHNVIVTPLVDVDLHQTEIDRRLSATIRNETFGDSRSSTAAEAWQTVRAYIKSNSGESATNYQNAIARLDRAGLLRLTQRTTRKLANNSSAGATLALVRATLYPLLSSARHFGSDFLHRIAKRLVRYLTKATLDAVLKQPTTDTPPSETEARTFIRIADFLGKYIVRGDSYASKAGVLSELAELNTIAAREIDAYIYRARNTRGSFNLWNAIQPQTDRNGPTCMGTVRSPNLVGHTAGYVLAYPNRVEHHYIEDGQLRVKQVPSVGLAGSHREHSTPEVIRAVTLHDGQPTIASATRILTLRTHKVLHSTPIAQSVRHEDGCISLTVRPSEPHGLQNQRTIIGLTPAPSFWVSLRQTSDYPAALFEVTERESTVAVKVYGIRSGDDAWPLEPVPLANHSGLRPLLDATFDTPTADPRPPTQSNELTHAIARTDDEGRLWIMLLFKTTGLSYVLFTDSHVRVFESEEPANLIADIVGIDLFVETARLSSHKAETGGCAPCSTYLLPTLVSAGGEVRGIAQVVPETGHNQPCGVKSVIPPIDTHLRLQPEKVSRVASNMAADYLHGTTHSRVCFHRYIDASFSTVRSSESQVLPKPTHSVVVAEDGTVLAFKAGYGRRTASATTAPPPPDRGK